MDLNKYASETVRIDVDLAPRIREGDSLASVTSVTPTADLDGVASMTVNGNPVVVQTNVRVSLSGGGKGNHRIKVIAQTTQGDTLVARPRMVVEQD